MKIARRRAILILLIVLATLTYGTTKAHAGNVACPSTSKSYPNLETYSWTQSFTDSYGQTTYEITAPCLVFLTVPFDITLTVSDTTYSQSEVAFGWALKDNGSIIAGGGWNNITVDANGNWNYTYTQTYTGTAVNHTLEFSFVDEGQGSGAHFWKTNLMSDVTVDPLPLTANAGPDVVLSSSGAQSTVILMGTAVDIPGRPVTYRWLMNGVEVAALQAAGPGGEAPLYLSSVPALPTGNSTFTLEAHAGTSVATDVAIVSNPATTTPPPPVYTPPATGSTDDEGVENDDGDHDEGHKHKKDKKEKKEKKHKKHGDHDD